MPAYLTGGRKRRHALDPVRVFAWCVLVPLPWVVLAVLFALARGLW